MTFLRMSDLNLHGKRVLIREDLNVPIKNGNVGNDARLRAALPTLRALIEQQAMVMIVSHLGRPEEGEWNETFSLAPIAAWLTAHLGQAVELKKDWLQGVNLQPGQIVLCENVRFNKGEESNDAHLSKQMAALCDVFVMDAFGTAHRAQASTHGVAQYAHVACAGPLLCAELDALGLALEHPAKPAVAIVGGSKVSSKLLVLNTLLEKVDKIIVGGGIANTFLAAQGVAVGRSLCEVDLIPQAKAMLQKAQLLGKEIILPVDVVVGHEIADNAHATECELNAIPPDQMILDVGIKTQAYYADILQTAGTILWNGPVGVFECEPFSAGTRALAMAIAQSPAFSIAGGGDTLAAVEQFGIENKISYISTGGGAFLEFLEGKVLPAVAVLQL